MPKAGLSSGNLLAPGSLEIGSPSNAQTESVGDRSLSCLLPTSPIFFMLAHVGVGYSNKRMPTIFLASCKREDISCKQQLLSLGGLLIHSSSHASLQE